MLHVKISAAFFAALCIAACDQMEQPSQAPSQLARYPEGSTLSPAELTERRIADLLEINRAVNAYHAAVGSFPRSDGFQSAATYGESWIPGLEPSYIKNLPRDPLNSINVNRPQYMYISNGSDYKLIAHGVGAACGQFVEQRGVRIDPARAQGDSCWAFGFFTEGMRDN